jgi:hypothetical protein
MGTDSTIIVCISVALPEGAGVGAAAVDPEAATCWPKLSKGLRQRQDTKPSLIFRALIAVIILLL